jgi:hypothetical protein
MPQRFDFLVLEMFPILAALMIARKAGSITERAAIDATFDFCNCIPTNQKSQGAGSTS